MDGTTKLTEAIKMAGSYQHLLANGGWSMIENMGDAHGCVEQLWWLVERVIGEEEAIRLLHSEYYPMCRGEMIPDAALNKVNDGMNH